jgi:hypothetical protein
VKPRRLMSMTRGEVEAAGERDHYRRLNEYEREQDRDGPDPSDRDVDPTVTWADLEVLADCLDDGSAWHGQNADGDEAA